VVLTKRDTRSAIGWMGIIWLVPILGVVLYAMFGINRVQRKALTLKAGARLKTGQFTCLPAQLAGLESARAAHLISLVRMIGELTGRPLLEGNAVVPLVNGDEAYPAMLAAIGNAKRSVTLASYIFDNDRAGKMFADALGAAVKRGVEVRVLIDDVGARYTIPSIEHALHVARVRVARFLPTFLPGRWVYANLRNHRKIMVVDGCEGFTGGLNIREGHDLALNPKYPIQDLHFHIRGPVVAQLQEVFASDWEFATGEVLSGDAWRGSDAKVGSVLARGITTGPDGDLDKLRFALLGAIACAEESISIVSPYFLPDDTLIAALGVAALRGVQVDIILPGVNNLWLVQWAATAQLWQVLQRGCRVWLTPPPFDHAKLMVVDRLWTLLGSANWDPRSLRLNFEFNVECYDAELACRLQDWIDRKRSGAQQVSLEQVEGRSLPLQLRDGVARLLTPYL
ncbi:MAG TPA: phospholipase D-like domain-containing protein, partial [Pirellulales bacterium]|nr:phospholipase D-like domain-containing protein [Pirellulales bacterium]